MGETYIAIGTDPTWMVAFFPLPVIVIAAIVRWRQRQPPLLTRLSIFTAAWFLFAALADVSTEWIFGIASIGLALHGFVHLKQSSPKSGHRFIPWAACLIFFFTRLSSLFGWRQYFDPDRIDVSGDSISEWRAEWVDCCGGTNSTPREYSKVAIFNFKRPWYKIRPEVTWTAAGDFNVGAVAESGDLYWGPQGPIRGASLGKRLCKWSGEDPKHAGRNSE